MFKVGAAADLIWYYYQATSNTVTYSGWNTGGPATALSHVGVIAAPIPAALFLMLSAVGGLLGLGWFRRRPETEVA